MSIVTDVLKLTPASRKFLVFSGINVISWQCIVGQVLVLFGRTIHMPPSLVGMLVSFLPLSMFLVILSIPAVEKYGPRKLLITTWLIRNLVALPVFAIPYVLSHWSVEASWYILLLATLSFSLVRAFGVGAWFPWLHELVPKDSLNTYFSTETIGVQSLTVFIMLGIAQVLNWGETIHRFFLVYAIGIGAGLASVWYARFIPGGVGQTIDTSTTEKFAVLVHAVKDCKYMRFIIYVIISFSAITWINVSSVLYLRDSLHFPDSRIMNFVAFGAIGVALLIRYCAKIAQKLGNHRALAVLMLGQALISFSWFFPQPGVSWTIGLVLPIMIGGAIVSAGFIIIASQTMMCLVQQEDRVGYTTVWIAGSALANGIPPILAGWLIDIFQLPGYRACFILSGASALLVALLWSRFKIEGLEVMPDMHHIIRPYHPLRTLQRITWMVLGMKKK
jgi:MFS family permease